MIDDSPRQLASTRRFTLGVPRAVTVSRDGGRVLFLRSQGGEDPVTCLRGSNWPAVPGTAAEDASGFSLIRRRPGTSVVAICLRPSGSGGNGRAN